MSDLEKQPQETLPGNVKDIPITDGVIRRISSWHSFANKASEWGSNVGAFALEAGSRAPPDVYRDKDKWYEFFLTKIVNDTQYAPICTFARENFLPVFGIDIPLPNDVRSKDNESLRIHTAIGGLALIAAVHLADLSRRNQSISRRRFITGSAALVGSVGAYLAGPNILALGSHVLPAGPAAKLAGLAGRLAEWQGHERLILGLRNLIFVRKLRAIVKYVHDTYDVDEPIIAAAVGGTHAEGLEEALKLDPVEVDAFINALLGEASRVTPRQASELRDLAEAIPMSVFNRDMSDWAPQILNAREVMLGRRA